MESQSETRAGGGAYAIAMGKELAMQWSEGKCDAIDHIENVCDDQSGGLT